MKLEQKRLIDGAKFYQERTFYGPTSTLEQKQGNGSTFEGYASVFGVVDDYFDIVEKGAFAKSLQTRKPKMLWQHDVHEVIGVWDEMKEDDHGLFVRGSIITETARGREAAALLKAGAIDAMSIGYRTLEAISEGPEGRVRKLLELDLFEVSLVTFPANEAARVTAVKSYDATGRLMPGAPDNKRDLERLLCEAVGLSRTEAKALIAGGFDRLSNLREADETDHTEGLTALMSSLTRLKENINA